MAGTDLGSCCKCLEPADRTLGAQAFCAACTELILAPIRERVAERDPFGGYGRQVGPRRLDYGPEWADLCCDRCGATWVGIVNAPCEWCDESYRLLLEVQRSVLLNPELPSPLSDDRKRAECAWAERLGRAVSAGILPKDIAHRTLKRELAKSA